MHTTKVETSQGQSLAPGALPDRAPEHVHAPLTEEGLPGRSELAVDLKVTLALHRLRESNGGLLELLTPLHQDEAGVFDRPDKNRWNSIVVPSSVDLKDPVRLLYRSYEFLEGALYIASGELNLRYRWRADGSGERIELREVSRSPNIAELLKLEAFGHESVTVTEASLGERRFLGKLTAASPESIERENLRRREEAQLRYELQLDEYNRWDSIARRLLGKTFGALGVGNGAAGSPEPALVSPPKYDPHFSLEASGLDPAAGERLLKYVQVATSLIEAAVSYFSEPGPSRIHSSAA